jgi:hypothetical protein
VDRPVRGNDVLPTANGLRDDRTDRITGLSVVSSPQLRFSWRSHAFLSLHAPAETSLSQQTT